jgi:hypothetical protein
MIDRDCGEQERITPNIYEIILPDIPQIVQEGLEIFHVGNRDYFDWIKSHTELNLTEIGNYGYNGRMEYLTTDRAKILANKLQGLAKSGYVNAYQEFYSHLSIISTESEAKEYFNEVLFFCKEAAEKDYALLFYIY